MDNDTLANIRKKGNERARRFRERRLQEGMKLHSILMPIRIIAAINEIVRMARENENLDVIVILQDRITGELVCPSPD